MTCLKRFLVAAVLLAAMLTNGHATTIIVLRDASGIYIAADSKVTHPNGSMAGYECKIHIVNDYVWAAAGLLNEAFGPFAVSVQAEAAIQGGSNLDTIAENFETRIVPQFEDLSYRLKGAASAAYNSLLNESKFRINMIFIKGSDFVTRDITIADSTDNAEVLRHSCAKECSATGSMQVILGEQKVVRPLIHLSATWRSGVVTGLSNLIQQQAASTSDVGGPISILRIGKDGSKTWLQPGKCTQTDEETRSDVDTLPTGLTKPLTIRRPLSD